MDGLQDVIGLGVAGNFTGHLEQAGEARDFSELRIDDPNAPKGVFPFYVPAAGQHFLHRYPLGSERVAPAPDGGSLQLEPELGLLCDLRYDGPKLIDIVPTAFGAYNDCSIRREGAAKISEKKNWGADSKGFSRTHIPLDRFEPGGVLDHFRIACLLVRDGEVHNYGVDSPVSGYTYFYGQLIEWLIDRCNGQRDEGPLEDISRWLQVASFPTRALISVGATRYTDFGENNFLKAGDDAYVLVYDQRLHTLEGLTAALPADITATEGLSLLHQRA